MTVKLCPDKPRTTIVAYILKRNTGGVQISMQAAELLSYNNVANGFVFKNNIIAFKDPYL